MPPDTEFGEKKDQIAESLRPSFAQAAQVMREILRSGGTGDVSVLFGHLPKAVMTVVSGMVPDERVFTMSIPSVVGRPDDPDSFPSFVSGTVKIDMLAGLTRSEECVSLFETSGPQILANTIRSCLVGLVHAGVAHEDLEAAVRDAVASVVMKG
jgi:hypothetical protein